MTVQQAIEDVMREWGVYDGIDESLLSAMRVLDGEGDETPPSPQ